jgi:Protein of unknown function (DUF3644)
MKARWKITLDASKEEALLAVDLYNQGNRSRRLEGFFVHMHMAWLYLFEAQYQRDKKDYHYRLPNGQFERIDGEPKTWELAKFVKDEFSDSDPVRRNIELTIALRNKIEHRFEDATTLATAGYAQALLLNYEENLTARFGAAHSLATQLRFPIFVGTLTREGAVRMADTQQKLPKATRDFLTQFEQGMSPSITQDHRYEFRVRLIPKLGTKTDADLALTFVRESDLSEDERLLIESLERSGTVIVREQIRSVSNENHLTPTQAAAAIEARIPFKFKIHHFVRAWKKEAVRPLNGDAHPERTKQDFCLYDRLHNDYVYTEAFVDKLVSLSAEVAQFKELTGLPAITKNDEVV